MAVGGRTADETLTGGEDPGGDGGRARGGAGRGALLRGEPQAPDAYLALLVPEGDPGLDGGDGAGQDSGAPVRRCPLGPAAPGGAAAHVDDHLGSGVRGRVGDRFGADPVDRTVEFLGGEHLGAVALAASADAGRKAVLRTLNAPLA